MRNTLNLALAMMLIGALLYPVQSQVSESMSEWPMKNGYFLSRKSHRGNKHVASGKNEPDEKDDYDEQIESIIKILEKELHLSGDSDSDKDYSNNRHVYIPKPIKKSSSAVQDRCHFNIKSNNIIKTTESLKNGAEFLNSTNEISQSHCSSKCCQSSVCNLAVYKEKKENSCYLFNCGKPSKCIFTHHIGYLTMNLIIEPKSMQMKDKEREELEELVTSMPKAGTTTTATTSNVAVSGESPGQKIPIAPNQEDIDEKLDAPPIKPLTIKAPKEGDMVDHRKTLPPIISHVDEATLSPVLFNSTHSHLNKFTIKFPNNSLRVTAVADMITNKTAIISLSLGLILTMFLLIMIGCRLRAGHVHIRKGVAVSSGEADYLINGMYL